MVLIVLHLTHDGKSGGINNETVHIVTLKAFFVNNDKNRNQLPNECACANNVVKVCIVFKMTNNEDASLRSIYAKE